MRPKAGDGRKSPSSRESRVLALSMPRARCTIGPDGARLLHELRPARTQYVPHAGGLESSTRLWRESPPLNMTPNQSAAHELLTELRTRITIQPLPYQYGVEARALESLWEVFAKARASMVKYPGCKEFADVTTRMLNVDLRPVTAKWHRAHKEGRLRARDGADEFRADLAAVQTKLRKFAKELHAMAYGAEAEEALTPAALPPSELDACFANLRFGIVGGHTISDDAVVGAINDAEANEVDLRREQYKILTASRLNAVALSLSGGGIRSATFCLGVVQTLAERGRLPYVDFLSTVSGGGYVGGFVTVRMGAESSRPSSIARPHGPDPEAIRYLRSRAKFLTAANLKERWTMVTATLAGMLLNWSAPLLVVALSALATTALAACLPVARLWPVAFAGMAGLSAIALLAYGVLLRRGRTAARWGGAILGVSVAATALAAAAWLLQSGYGLFLTSRHSHWLLPGGLSVLSAAAVMAGPSILRFMPVLRSPAVRKAALTALLLLAAAVVPLVTLALFYACLVLAAEPRDPLAASFSLLRYGSGTCVLLVAAGILSVAAYVLNINLTGLHRLYRDALARTFVQTSDAANAPKPLKNINAGHRAPYHIMNATVNLPSSEAVGLRERKGDFFMFSKHWCGSAVTTYDRTDTWNVNGSPLDLGTAIATSGAAASPHMGLGAMPTLTALMTLLNVRLGIWIRQPARGGGWPGFTCLLREMTGIGMSEKAAWLNLTDGGHIENMAVYEMLRRRVKFILCVDGESDPKFTFGGLMTLVRHAQIDFGIRIEPKLDSLRIDAKTRLSQTHFSMCRIHYPASSPDRPAEMGLFLYLKLSVTGNEPELVRRYRAAHPEFPHQSTLDQFFDQEQFEAYRQLGVHVAEGLFSRALMGGDSDPVGVHEWFYRLAGNLLEPEGV